MFNNDVDYALSRIQNTWMRRKDSESIFFVTGLERSTKDFTKAVLCGYDERGTGDRVLIQNLKFEPGQLGFINDYRLETGPTFTARTPKRNDWRQGLRGSQLVFFGYKNKRWVSGTDRDLDPIARGLKRTLTDDYPTLDKAIELVEEAAPAVAFSRNFCLASDRSLYYQTYVKIGELRPDEKLSIRRPFTFLKEELSKKVGEARLVLQ